MVDALAFILFFMFDLLIELVFAIVVRIPQFFFYLLTKSCNWVGRLVKGGSSNDSVEND